MQEKARSFKSSWCYSRFLIHFSMRKKWHILCLRIPVLKSKQVVLSYIHTRQPTNPRPMATNFYGLVGYDRVKNYPLWSKSVCIPDQPLLYPRCIPDAPALKPRSSRPTHVLPADQSPLCTTNPRPIPDATTLTTLNIGPTPDLISTLGLKWIIQANVMPTDNVLRVQYPKCAHDPYC